MLIRNATTANGQPVEVWAKPLAEGKVAVFAVNVHDDGQAAAPACSATRDFQTARQGADDPRAASGALRLELEWVAGWKPSVWPNGTAAAVRDVWGHEDLPRVPWGGALTTCDLEPHHSVFYVLSPVAAPAGTSTTDSALRGTPSVVGHASEEQCFDRCSAFGHCCAGVGGPLDGQCDGRSGRLSFPLPQPPILSCFMGCTVAAHSADVSSCKSTCREAQLGADPCSFRFAAANTTFNKCGKCPASCKIDHWTGQYVGDGECEQACDFVFGCAAPSAPQSGDTSGVKMVR